MTDDDTIHRVGLMFGMFQVAILLMVEVANQEKWKSRLPKHLIYRTSNIPALPLFKRCYNTLTIT